MNRRSLLAIAVLALLGGVLSAQSPNPSRTSETVFAPGGCVWMTLASGNYEIRAGRDDRVLVTLRTSDPDDAASLQATLERKGRDLLLATKGPRGGMKVIVEMPARSDLNVRLTAGDLRVRGIEGSKDISSWAGDLDVEVGTRDAYQSVHASVTAGDLEARAFGVNKGGLFRSFTWQGKGTRTLDVRLTAGNLKLR